MSTGITERSTETMLVDGPEQGAIQIAHARRESGFQVGMQSADAELVLGIPGGGMGCYTQAEMVKTLVDYGFGPERFEKSFGFSGGALVLASFVARQHDIAPEGFRHLAQSREFMDRSVLWERERSRPVINLSFLEQLLTESDEFGLDTEAIYRSSTELLFTTAKIDGSCGVNVKTTKGKNALARDELIPSLIRGATMPVLGPDAQNSEADGGTWDSTITSLWDEVLRQMNAENTKEQHLLILDNSRFGSRPSNLLAAPLVGRWITRQAESGMSAMEACRKFFGGQAEHLYSVLTSYLTGSIATRAASVQVIRPPETPLGPSSTDLSKFDQAKRIAQKSMLEALENPDKVRTYQPVETRPSMPRSVASRSAEALHALFVNTLKGTPVETDATNQPIPSY